MKNHPSMKYKTSPLHVLPIVALAMGLFLPSVRAAFITGFETSSGYGTNASVIGVYDTAAPSGNLWFNTFSLPANNPKMISSTANPQTGSQALRLTNDGTSGALGASIQLGTSVDVANPFNIHFAMALNNISAGTGNQMQVYFGFANAQAGIESYWMTLLYNNGDLFMQVNNSTNNGVDIIALGAYTTYSALGSYISFDLAIDPTSNKFTNVQLTGSLTSANLTSTVLASPSGGTIPHLSATPNTIFSFISGGNDTITADFDNLQITAVPEPSAVGLLVFGAAAVVLVQRRMRISVA